MPKRTASVEEVLRGQRIAPLPKGDVVVGVMMLIKTLDADGDECWYTRNSADMGTVELIGGLTVELKRLKDDFHSNWRSDEDDD